MEWMGSCTAFKAFTGISYSCCSSCHDDDDEGYCELPEVEIGKQFWTVCCAGLIEWDEQHE